MRTVGFLFVALAGFLSFGTAGCTLKATFESTTDTTSNFLSSTTPGAWVSEDGLLKAEHKLTAFTTLNQANIEQDIARGQGEYLSALSELLGVHRDHQEAFYSSAQSRYPLVNTGRSGPSDPVEMFALDRTPDSHQR